MKRLLALLVIIGLPALAQLPKPGSGTGGGGSVSLSGTTDGSALCNIGGVLADCPPGTYAADVASADPWTISGATHGLESCDVSVTTQTESAGVRTWVIPAGWTCDEATFDISIDFASATAGRVAILKNGGGGGGGGGLNNVVEDTTPQLGGNLDLNSFVITGLVIGTNVQAWDADLDTIAGLAKTDDALPVGNGTIWQMKTLPDCDDSGGNHLNYDTATNAFSCGTSGGSGSFPAATAYQVYRRNSDDTADEAATVTAGTGVTVTPSSGQITISSDCAQVACLAQNNAYLGNNAYAGTTVQTPSATQTLVAGDAITVSTITFKSISAASAITLTSTPTIAPGTAGQELILVNDGSNSITLQDEANLAGSSLCLPADTNITLAPKEALRGVMSVTSACWIFFR